MALPLGSKCLKREKVVEVLVDVDGDATLLPGVSGDFLDLFVCGFGLSWYRLYGVFFFGCRLGEVDL